MKPRVVTIVLPTQIRPYKRISLLLNRRSAASLEQLLLDVTEAFQIPRWHNDHVRHGLQQLYCQYGELDSKFLVNRSPVDYTTTDKSRIRVDYRSNNQQLLFTRILLKDDSTHCEER